MYRSFAEKNFQQFYNVRNIYVSGRSNTDVDITEQMSIVRL